MGHVGSSSLSLELLFHCVSMDAHTASHRSMLKSNQEEGRDSHGFEEHSPVVLASVEDTES